MLHVHRSLLYMVVPAESNRSTVIQNRDCARANPEERSITRDLPSRQRSRKCQRQSGLWPGEGKSLSPVLNEIHASPEIIFEASVCSPSEDDSAILSQW